MEKSFRSFTGNKDVDRKILGELPDADILKNCSLNSYLSETVCDSEFFKAIVKKRYPEMYEKLKNDKNTDWRSLIGIRSFTGEKYLDREILKRMSDEDIIKSCSLNKYLLKVVCDDSFFQQLVKDRFPNIYERILRQRINPEWKNIYLQMIKEVAELKEDFGVEYDQREGEPDEVYSYHAYLNSEQKYDYINDNLFRYTVKNNKVDLFNRILKYIDTLYIEPYIAIEIVLEYGNDNLLKILLAKMSNMDLIQDRIDPDDYYERALDLNKKEMILDLFQYIDGEYYRIEDWVTGLNPDKLDKFLKFLSEKRNDKRAQLILERLKKDEEYDEETNENIRKIKSYIRKTNLKEIKILINK
jgi:hypothetical protein